MLSCSLGFVGLLCVSSSCSSGFVVLSWCGSSDLSDFFLAAFITAADVTRSGACVSVVSETHVVW